MSDHDNTLAALVGSRLCHDLISPIGAIQNGLELVEMAGVAATPEMSLIQDSCASAAARIKFYRVAFGAAESGHRISRREITGTLDGVCQGSRSMAVWEPVEDQPRDQVQLVYLAFLCCESALPQGGTVRISKDAAAWVVEATAPRLNVDPGIWRVLDNQPPAEALTASKVHFALLEQLCRARDTPLAWGSEGGVLRLTLRSPVSEN